jgi:hypothetical protein
MSSLSRMNGVSFGSCVFEKPSHRPREVPVVVGVDRDAFDQIGHGRAQRSLAVTHRRRAQRRGLAIRQHRAQP